MPVPRRKCCAGGLTLAAAPLLPAAVHSVFEQEIRAIRVSSVGGHSVEWSSATPFMYTASRERLDAALWREAVGCGVDARDGCEVLRAERTGECVVLTTSDLAVRCRVAVGADGAAGICARAGFGGRRRHAAVGVALEYQREPENADANCERVDLIVRLPGHAYGWVFPGRETLSVGIEMHGRGTDREAALEQVRAVAGVSGRTPLYRGVHPIPTSLGRRVRVVCDRVLLVGDAAGLCDPLTGEGVRHALMSAAMAAEAIEQGLKDGPGALQQYETAVNQIIVPELRSAMLILRFLLQLEPVALFLLQHEERARRAALAMLRGELSYESLLWRVGGIRGFIAMLGRSKD